MKDLGDRTLFRDYAVQAPHLMIEVQKGQIQECQVREELELERNLPIHRTVLFSL